MPYSQTMVLLGGLIHIPIVIFVLIFIESRFKKLEPQYGKN